jgi:hypothetical protein
MSMHCLDRPHAEEPAEGAGIQSVLRESLRFGDIGVPGRGRMDNLLKVHIE